MIFVPKLLNKNRSEKNNKYYPSGGVGRTLENTIRVVGSAERTLESKGNVRHCHKRAYLIYIFQNTHQK